MGEKARPDVIFEFVSLMTTRCNIPVRQLNYEMVQHDYYTITT